MFFKKILLIIYRVIIVYIKPEPSLRLTLFFNQIKCSIMSVTLNTKQFLDGKLALVDHITGQPIEAVISNEQFASSDESVFTTTQPEDDTVEVTGVSVGTAQLTVTADCTYTDANTGEQFTKSKSINIDVEITQPISEEETDLVVNFK